STGKIAPTGGRHCCGEIQLRQGQARLEEFDCRLASCPQGPQYRRRAPCLLSATFHEEADNLTARSRHCRVDLSAGIRSCSSYYNCPSFHVMNVFKLFRIVYNPDTQSLANGI